MDRRYARRLRDDARSGFPARLCRREGRAAPSESLTTLRLTVEYDGTAFSGFQWQREERTVAGALESALSRLFSEPVKVTGAGRTDRGVHATGQVVSLSTGAAFPFERLLVGLRGVLASDCSVREAACVADDFSARFCARERTYLYAILNRGAPSALLARYAWYVPQSLDLDAMKAAAAHLLGKHDFRSFAAAAAEERTVRCVRRLTIESRGELLRIEVAADGFLRHMVRTIVGTLVECGSGGRVPGDVAAMLAARERSAAGSVAPAHGLYLAGVRYAGGYDSFAEPPIFANNAPSI